MKSIDDEKLKLFFNLTTQEILADGYESWATTTKTYAKVSREEMDYWRRCLEKGK